MFRRLAFISILASIKAIVSIDIGSDISAESKIGKSLLSKARKLENADDGEVDMSWIAQYSLKFHSCHTIDAFGGEEGGGEEEGQSPVGDQHLVQFQLCPTKSCSAGSSKKNNYCGDYIVQLRDFVESFAEFKEEEKEQACEAAKEACEYYACNDDDEEACENQCLASKGYDYCIEDENEEEFDLAEYLECREAEFGNGNNNNGVYYMGPYCSNSGTSIHLGVFTDSSCSIQAKSNVYETYNYGATLPYSKDSIVDNKCHSCLEVDDNDDANGNDAYYDAELIQLCEETYELSGKCETNVADLDDNTKNEFSCTYINSVIPAMENVHFTQGKSSGAATAFAWIFFFSTIGAAAFAYTLHQKVQRGAVKL